MAKVLIVTDAWLPQTNGVVRSLEAVGREMVAIWSPFATNLTVSISVSSFQ